jgi:hypothetical protein
MIGIRATAERDGQFWFVRSTDLRPPVFAQTRRLDKAADALREVLGLLLPDEDVSEWVIEVTPKVTGRPQRLVDVARWLRETAGEAERLAQYATAAAAFELSEEGVSQRDIGRLLGISFQRVSQLLARHPEPMTLEQMRGYLNALDAGLGGVRKALEPEEQEEHSTART